MTLWVKWKHREGELLPGFNPASPADVLRRQVWEDCDCENGRQFEYTPGDLGTRSWPCNQCAYGLVPAAGMVEAAVTVYVNGPPLKDLPTLNLPHLRLVTRRALVEAARWEGEK